MEYIFYTAYGLFLVLFYKSEVILLRQKFEREQRMAEKEKEFNAVLTDSKELLNNLKRIVKQLD